MARLTFAQAIEAGLDRCMAILASGLNPDGTAINVDGLKLGAHANAWNAAVTGVNGTSTALQIGAAMFVSAFGNASAATTITLQYSQDGTNYYDGPTQVLGGAGNFRIDATMGCEYARLKSSASVTATATLAAKG